MYYYEQLRRKICENGDRYSPYLHKQHLPFQVLTWAQSGRDPSNYTVIKGLIRAVRDVHNIPNYLGYKPILEEIWNPAFEAFSKYLEYIGFNADESKPARKRVREQLIDFGFDPIADPYRYSRIASDGRRKLTLSNIAVIIKFIFMDGAYVTEDKFDKRLQKYYNRYAISIRRTHISESCRDEFLTDLKETFLEAYKRSGMFFTLQYFDAFAKKYQLSEKTTEAIRKALGEKDYVDYSTLGHIFDELNENHKHANIPYPVAMRNMFDICFSATGYTRMFGR